MKLIWTFTILIFMQLLANKVFENSGDTGVISIILELHGIQSGTEYKQIYMAPRVGLPQI